MESSPANVFVKNMGHQDVTILHFWRELPSTLLPIMCQPPLWHMWSNALEVITKIVFHQFGQIEPQMQMTYLKNTDKTLVIKPDE